MNYRILIAPVLGIAIAGAAAAQAPTPEYAFARAHVDSALTGIMLTSQLHRRIDSTITATLASFHDSDRTRAAYPGNSTTNPGTTGSVRTDTAWSMPQRTDTAGANRGAAAMRTDSLDGATRQRLIPVLERIDAAVRPMLSASQQRVFDRNLDSWRHRQVTATR